MTRGLGVLESPALPLLLQLEAEGFRIAADGDRLLVNPIHRLSPEVRIQVRTYRVELLTLVRVCDVGVQARRLSFASQHQAGLGVGQLAFVSGLPYVSGVCYSCGDALPRPVYGRCWRCALAWRLALGLAITAQAGEAYDAQRVVA